MPDLSDQLAVELPYVRRYARALTGNQNAGDDLVFEMLQSILSDRANLLAEVPLRVAMFRIFHQIWETRSEDTTPTVDGGALREAQLRLLQLTKNTREALLLTTIEEFTPAQAAIILGRDVTSVESLIQTARQDMQDGNTGAILIIEDEPIIASDLSRIVENAGHKVIGVGRTRDEAVSLGKIGQPDLILADIQLADGSSGIDATHDLLGEFGDIPVIFITAFPERLLTGTRPEPAFLISKPYDEHHVTSAVSQAMFFASTTFLSEI